jgi:MtN3 and saliva related transmembrane protein
MKSDIESMIGFVAAICTTLPFVPQMLRVVKTKDVSGISLGRYIIFVIGLFLWIIYEISIQDVAIICSNTFIIIFASIILVCKIR